MQAQINARYAGKHEVRGLRKGAKYSFIAEQGFRLFGNRPVVIHLLGSKKRMQARSYRDIGHFFAHWDEINVIKAYK